MIFRKKIGKVKQAIIVRTDLKIGRGKLAVQVAHASLEAYKKANNKIIKRWEKEGCKKVVLKVSSLDDISKLKEEADKIKIPYALIRDAGLTQLKKGTITCLALGPDEEEKIDKITKKLKLL